MTHRPSRVVSVLALALAIELVPLMLVGVALSALLGASFEGQPDEPTWRTGMKLSGLLTVAALCWLVFFLSARCIHIAVRVVGSLASAVAVAGCLWVLFSQLNLPHSTSARLDSIGGDGSGMWLFLFLMVALGALAAIGRGTGRLTSLVSRILAAVPAILLVAVSAYYLAIAYDDLDVRLTVLGPFLVFGLTLIAFMAVPSTVDDRPTVTRPSLARS